MGHEEIRVGCNFLQLFPTTSVSRLRIIAPLAAALPSWHGCAAPPVQAGACFEQPRDVQMQVLANHLARPVQVCIGKECCFPLQPQQRLVLWPAQESELPGPCAPLPVRELARVLAHWDHAHGLDRIGPALPVRMVVEQALEVPEQARHWLIGQLLQTPRPGRDLPLYALLRQLARSETYALVRLLLAHGAHDTVAGLAQRYGLSVAQFNRRCRAALGGPLKRELRQLRAARALLAYPGRAHTFTHVAADHGYSSLSHFCTEIKSLIGRSPQSVYRAFAPASE
ncbi:MULTISPECIES: helix-turn-helix domain-containing protein [Stenotrophomonas]|jgi:AraC-like DNA-binding protein|uniref:helix-turn-helix domain-containing protein n=1 Tax=Stenotrophomonas TaxID=40323 RepID=UPI0013DD380B|nr:MULTISPECIES: helix-turn-helix domain-containing protein [Stenotrophomonas]